LNSFQIKKARIKLAEAIKTLDLIISQISVNTNISDYSYEVWEIYSNVEYSILMLKLHLGQENFGKFVLKNKIKENDLVALVKVFNYLKDALNDLDNENYIKAIESARRAKRVLHTTLLTIRKIRFK